MNKTTNQYINQLNLDSKREAAVRKLVEGAGGVSDSTPLVENLVGNELIPIKQDGENKAVSVEQIKNKLLELPSKYEFVDLGLPSGTKWATCNVGASKPEDFGLYFAWGETVGYTPEDVAAGKKAFNSDDYKFGTHDNLTKYNATDGLTQLELVDDAAYQSDNTCRMPTKSEIQELIDNTTNTWETLNGVNGRRFTSKTNGNSIFVPAAGNWDNGSDDIVGFYGSLWSSSLDESYPSRVWYLSFDSDYVFMSNYGYRYGGFTVRAVKSPNTPTTINLNGLQYKLNAAIVEYPNAAIVEYPYVSTEAVALTDRQIEAIKNNNTFKIKLTISDNNYFVVSPLFYEVVDNEIHILVYHPLDDGIFDYVSYTVNITNKTIIRLL